MNYTSAHAVTLTGISKDMLHYLCKVGIVIPSGRKSSSVGHGVPRRYTFNDLVSFKVVKRLCDSGVSPMKVKRAIHELHQMKISISSLPVSKVVIFDKSVYKWDGKGDPFRAVDGQRAFGFILDLKSIHDELVADLSKARAAG